MSPKPISVRREDEYIVVDFPLPDGLKYFEDPKGLGDAVIGLRKYYEKHMNDIPRPAFEISSELDGGPCGEDYKLKDALRGLYAFKEH